MGIFRMSPWAVRVFPGGRGDVQRPAYNVRREIRELAYFRDTSKLAATSSFVGPKSQLFFTLLVDETRLRSSPSRDASLE